MKMETRKSDRIVIRLRAHFHAFMEDFRVGNCAVIRRRERERERKGIRKIIQSMGSCNSIIHNLPRRSTVNCDECDLLWTLFSYLYARRVYFSRIIDVENVDC